MRTLCATIFAVLACAADMAAAAMSSPKWISGGTDAPESPAPTLVREFALDVKPTSAVLTVAVAGWCEIEVEGEAGAKVRLDYDESINNRNVLLGDIKQHTAGSGEKRPVQHDEYVLAGREGGEMWHPRFTYHGFRYVQVEFDGKAKLKSIKARFVHSAFERAGTLETSDATFAALQSATERSYLSNFVGIPTDCQHREKNGWTGDAQLAMETGLWNFDAKGSYVHFLRMAVDAQRQNGAVSVREGWSVAGSTTDDAALARWGDGNRLRLSGNAGILLVLEGK